MGSIALGILGNAIYDLLAGTFGATPGFLVAIVVVTALVFAFMVIAFRCLLLALDQRRVVTHNRVEPDQQAEAHAGLILPVGLNLRSAEQAIIEAKPGNVAAPRVMGFDDRAIHDATHVTGYFNYINRVADALHVEQESFVRAWEQPPAQGDGG